MSQTTPWRQIQRQTINITTYSALNVMCNVIYLLNFIKHNERKRDGRFVKCFVIHVWYFIICSTHKAV